MGSALTGPLTPKTQTTMRITVSDADDARNWSRPILVSLHLVVNGLGLQNENKKVQECCVKNSK
jgi:hypothetical protein